MYGATFAVLASHAAETLTLNPVLADDRALTTLDGDEVLEGVTLDPFGIGMFKVTGSEPADRPLRAARSRPRTVPGHLAVSCWPDHFSERTVVAARGPFTVRRVQASPCDLPGSRSATRLFLAG
jgi:hypothetical protein